MSLYKIHKDIESILDSSDERVLNENGELDIDAVQQLLTQIEVDFAVELENLALYSKNLKSEANELEVEETHLKARKDAKRKKAQRLDELITQELIYANMDKLETSRAELRLTTRKTLEYDESQIPEEWYREKVERAVDKKGIKEAVRQGEIIPGVTETKKKYLTIK